MKKTLLFLVAGLLLMVTSAMATTFDFTYSGAFNGSGVLTATANGDGSFTAIAGTDVDSTFGSLALEFNPAGTNIATSSDGLWYFDNQLTPNLPSALLTVNNGGLLFTGGNVDLNLYGNGSSQYTAWTSVGGSYIPAWDGILIDPNITFTLTAESAPVPEPCTIMLLGVGFFGLAVYGKRRKDV